MKIGAWYLVLKGGLHPCWGCRDAFPSPELPLAQLSARASAFSLPSNVFFLFLAVFWRSQTSSVQYPVSLLLTKQFASSALATLILGSQLVAHRYCQSKKVNWGNSKTQMPPDTLHVSRMSLIIPSSLNAFCFLISKGCGRHCGARLHAGGWEMQSLLQSQPLHWKLSHIFRHQGVDGFSHPLLNLKTCMPFTGAPLHVTAMDAAAWLFPPTPGLPLPAPAAQPCLALHSESQGAASSDAHWFLTPITHTHTNTAVSEGISTALCPPSGS